MREYLWVSDSWVNTFLQFGLAKCVRICYPGHIINLYQVQCRLTHYDEGYQERGPITRLPETISTPFLACCSD